LTPEEEGVDFVVVKSVYCTEFQYVFELAREIFRFEIVLCVNKDCNCLGVLYQFEIRE
jgi:hypothetical protein